MRRIVSTALALGAIALLTPAAQAAEPSFSGGGLVAGTEHVVVYGRDFSVAKREFSGAPDTSFGINGVAKVTFPRFKEPRSSDAVVQLGGRIVVAGFVTVRCHLRRGQHCGRRLAFARFLSSGRPDPSFGSNGKVVTNFGLGGVVGRAYTVIAEGRKLLVAGVLGSGWPAVGRLRFDGSPDSRFGNNGVAVLDPLGAGAGQLEGGRAESIALQADGRILVSVGVWPAASPYRAGLVRLEPDGSIDPSFGARGFLANPIGRNSFPGYPRGHPADYLGATADEPDVSRHRFGFMPQPDGSILVAAATSGPSSHLVLMRLRSDGSPDYSYGVDGLVRGPDSVQVRFAPELTTAPGGVVYVGVPDFLHSDLLRFSLDGSLDLHFGSGGVAQQFESWGARASLEVLGDGSVAIADDRREAGGLLVGRYSLGGSLMWTATLP
jgi:uncharacterized delta-60 repeat protein